MHVSSVVSQALESLMSACSSLYNQSATSTNVLARDIVNCMELFTKEDYSNEFDVKVGRKLRQYRSLTHKIQTHDMTYEYASGKKRAVEPREVENLTALLKYIGYEAPNERLFYDGPEKSSRALFFLDKTFQITLQDPILLIALTESIMNVMEAVILCPMMIFGYHGTKCWNNINATLRECCNDKEGGSTVTQIPIAWEIITRYKSRICTIRSKIEGDYLDKDSLIYGILYMNTP